ncbi:MAG: phosphoribosylformylglycinamidine synthase I [Acidimicrobiales bacterium]
MSKPKALVLHARGTNRDEDLCDALRLAGAEPEVVPLTVLRRDKIPWDKYQMLALPGGFSHADSLGAGRLFALDLQSYFAEELAAMNEAGWPIIGICNGFQALVRTGLLPGDGLAATLTDNSSGKFECRWVRLAVESQDSLWTAGLSEPIDCPIAHGEGRFALSDADLDKLERSTQVVLRYANTKGDAADGVYPMNPNGSVNDIAGITNASGNMLGLMPHPENHVRKRQAMGEKSYAWPFFRNGVQFAAGS